MENITIIRHKKRHLIRSQNPKIKRHIENFPVNSEPKTLPACLHYPTANPAPTHQIRLHSALSEKNISGITVKTLKY